MDIDKQKQKVYDWERVFVAPYDKNTIPINNVKPIVDWIWQNEGLQYPPLVEQLPKQAKAKAGDGCRTKVRFKEKTYTWIVIHELAHSMTSNIDHESNSHGALFMGIYIQLLHRYLKLPYQTLVDSALGAGLKIKLDAKPVFI